MTKQTIDAEETIASLRVENVILRATVEAQADTITKLREALKKIANSKHNNYENNQTNQYGIGVTDGHRYCATIARAILEETK